MRLEEFRFYSKEISFLREQKEKALMKNVFANQGLYKKNSFKDRDGETLVVKELSNFHVGTAGAGRFHINIYDPRRKFKLSKVLRGHSHYVRSLLEHND